MVLVLDQHTAQLFSRLNLSFYELYRHSVFQVAELGKQRKRYPMTDVIYFLSPTHDSVTRLIAEFPEQDEYEYD